MSLVILTRSPSLNLFSIETYKKAFRKVFKKNRGPQAVTASLIRGLNSLGYEYLLNPKASDIKMDSTIWINESIEALQWAIPFKKQNKNVKLIVGPNLVVVPTEHDGIILDENIDVVLQPSEWTKKLYEKYKADLSSKIKIWPAGVADPYKAISTPVKENYLVIYQKNSPDEILEATTKYLNSKGIPFHVIKYGNFKHEEYLSLLEPALGIVYLSASESQGLALQEAWIRNTPSLVWDRGYWEYESNKFEHELISSPYLTNESGLQFRNISEIPEKIDDFLKKIPEFRARDYCLRELSDEVTTAKFLDIISLK